MTKQTSSILAITPQDTQNKLWHPPQDLSFASNTALLPIHAGELAKAAASMPLAIIKQDAKWQLVAICGQEANQNLYIKNGLWQGIYQPLWLNTWPFSIYAVGDKGFAVMDTASGVLSTDASGEAFFNEDNQPSPALAKRLEPLAEQHQMQARTARALEILAAANLIVPWPEALYEQAEISLEGLYMLDEQALVKLSDEDFLKIRQALPLAYAINFSVQQLHILGRLKRLHGNAQPVSSNNSGDLFADDDNDTISFG